jgi:hypothetical protein
MATHSSGETGNPCGAYRMLTIDGKIPRSQMRSAAYESDRAL